MPRSTLGFGLVRSLRSHFWFAPDGDAVHDQQAALIRRNFIAAFASWVIAAWVQAIGQSILLNANWPFFWAGVYTLHSGSASLYLYWQDKHAPTRAPKQRLTELVAWMTGAGLLWAVLASLVIPYRHAEALMLYTVFITGISGGALALASPYLPAFLGFMVPPLAAIGLICLSLSTSPIFVATGFGGGIYLTAMWFFSANTHHATRETILLRFENRQLLENLKQQTEVAETARHHAEEADLAKSKFLAAASHDLRQPIHAVSLFLSALDRTNMTATQQDILASTDNAVKASREMLEALLDFSRIDAEVVQAAATGFALQPMLYRVFNEFGQQADGKNLVLRLRDTGCWAFADPLLTELIVRNLLSNAIRYTDHGGILLGVRQRGREAVIEMWDTGIGIAKQDQQAIFREFHQLGNPERDQRKGLGLGLAIVDGLCRAMNVRVSVQSRPGYGSVFRLHLPLAAPQAKTDAPVIAMPHRQASADWPALLRGLRVLAIDDNESVQNAIRLLLAQQQCDCKTAGSIQDALALLPGWQPDVLVVDYRLREHQTGGDAIRIVRGHLGHAIPAIIITGDTAPQRLRDAYRLNAPLLHKPLTGEALFKAIADVADRAV